MEILGYVIVLHKDEEQDPVTSGYSAHDLIYKDREEAVEELVMLCAQEANQSLRAPVGFVNEHRYSLGVLYVEHITDLEITEAVEAVEVREDLKSSLRSHLQTQVSG